MRRMTGLMLTLGLLSAGLFCGCDDEYVPGEGARRYGAVQDEVADSADAGGTIEVAAAASALVPAVKKDAPGKAPAETRGSARRKTTGSKAKYTVIAGGVKDGGTIAGTITLAGEGPHGVKPIEITKDLEKCGHKEHPSERVVMDEATRGLANCLVRSRTSPRARTGPRR